MEKQPHEKKISELTIVTPMDIVWRTKPPSIEEYLRVGDLKQWAIAVVKENRKRIKKLLKRQEKMKYPSDEERIVSVDIATLNGQNILLKDRFELTEEELK